MGRFVQDGTGIVVSVDDSKDDRFISGWQPFTGEDVKPAPKKSTPAAKSAN